MPKSKDKNLWPGMTTKQHRQILNWLRSTSERLGLRDWTISLKRLPLQENDEALAMVTCVYGQRHAVIRLCQDFASLSPTDQRKVLVHELLHCHLDRIAVPFRADNVVGRAIGDISRDILEEQVREAIEHAVDAIAREVCIHYPFPLTKKGK